MKHLVSPELSGKVSGLGWGLGYLGGLLCFVACYPLLAGGLSPENLPRFRVTFTITAAFYLLLSLPALIVLRRVDRDRHSSVASSGRGARQAYSLLWHTLRNWRRHKEVFKFLLGFYLVSDAIVAVIFFTAIYLEQNFGLTITKILILTLVVQAIGAPATILFGFLGDRFGQKRVVLVTILIWLIVVGIMIFGTGPYTPWLMAVVMGLVLGSTQSLLRSMYAQMVPPDAVNEFFGFNAFAGKVSAVLGPLAFAALAGWSGSQRIGLLSLVAFFLLGGIVLSTVRADRRPHPAGAGVPSSTTG